MRQARHGTPGAYGAVVVALAALAGCFDDKGLGIEVDVGDTHASKIELYLGKVACNAADNDAGIDCSSIAPPDGTVAPPTGTVALGGDIWFRDSPLPRRGGGGGWLGRRRAFTISRRAARGW